MFTERIAGTSACNYHATQIVSGPHSQLVEGFTTQALFRVAPLLSPAAIIRHILCFKKNALQKMQNKWPLPSLERLLVFCWKRRDQTQCGQFYHWNMQLKQLPRLHHRTEQQEHFNRTVTNSDASAALRCSPGSSESYLLTERKPSRPRSSYPGSQPAASSLPYETASEPSLSAPKRSGTYCQRHFL